MASWLDGPLFVRRCTLHDLTLGALPVARPDPRGPAAHKYVDAHHILHWADGGETKMGNLVLLCRHHHRLVHEGGYGARMTATGPKFTDPTGRTIAPAAETRFRGKC